MNIKEKVSLPTLLAGPIVRHCDAKHANFWLVTSVSCQLRCRLTNKNTRHIIFEQILVEECNQVQIGTHAFIQLVSIKTNELIPNLVAIDYSFDCITPADNTTGVNKEKITSLTNDTTHLLYSDEIEPNFIINKHVDNILHGSCRKPHFPSKDGLALVDDAIKNSLNIEGDITRPSLLMMSGDQVYCDDVAGPMLVAIHQVIERLGLYDEQWTNLEDSLTSNSTQLFAHKNNYYQRQKILPKYENKQHFLKSMLPRKQFPIFSSTSANNHLITVSEMFAMYLLVWSPIPWSLTRITSTEHIPKEYKATYKKELDVVEKFIETLPKVSRALAHIPCYMIFDDHDITDDWNLTRGWEEAAYNNPFSKRIIGNALIAYSLCQGWGNTPEKFEDLITTSQLTFTDEGLKTKQLDDLIDKLYQFNQWHYHLNTSPKIVVLNTRTERWRSESNENKPSGLMDWESLCALQTELIDQSSIIMVSPAPIYGLKLIETIQRIFTFFGKPLAVDAENWMAHRGTASVILNIFKHHKTPPHFIILSGDVHYSFVYKVTHRFIRNNSTITQITCSGIKNAFPDKIIKVLERLNHYLYGRYSPLNWFTKRRGMRISVQRPEVIKSKKSSYQRVDKNVHQGNIYHSLYNGSGIGLLTIKHDHEVEAKVITVNGDMLMFKSKENSDRT